MNESHLNLVKNQILPSEEDKQYASEDKSNKTKTDKGPRRWAFDLQWTQHYFGTFLLNNLHGEGIYKWSETPDKKTTFEGNFYANDLEGYGRISYNDQRTFEGLFKKNRPFGPGVLTYSNGTQDVGFWDNKQLVRLSCAVYPDWVPKLGKTSVGKTKLLGYRIIISIENQSEDIAKKILESLGADEETLMESDKLYASFIRNPNSYFFNKPMYDEQFHKNTDYLINVAENPENISQHSSQRRNSEGVSFSNYSKASGGESQDASVLESLTKQVKISELLAWNNGQLSIDMLKHTFLNRKSEKEVSFKLCKLVTGVRTAFLPPGEQESACVDFLKSCSIGNRDSAVTLLLSHHLNPDVCDVKGNSGIIYAAARDRLTVIKELWNYGANIDFFNDEGLTALTLCLCRYLALLYRVLDWEPAFLQDIDLENTEKESLRHLYPSLSLRTVSAVSMTGDNEEESEDSKADTEIRPKLVESFAGSTPKASVSFLTESISPMSDGVKSSELKSRKVSFSFTKIISIINELASSEDHSAAVFNKRIIHEIRERLIKERSDKNFSEFQEPYVYVPQTDLVQNYIFYQDYVIPMKQKSTKKNAGKGKTDKKKGKQKKAISAKPSKKSISQPENTEPVETEEMIQQKIIKQKLELVAKTILTLLEMGADSNIGDVPMPVILLGTFTKNKHIFRQILANCENPNVTTPKDNLTPFHVLATFSPTEETVAMCDELGQHKADPNLRANPNHWSPQKEQILAKFPLVLEDVGKSPLQLLCMRADHSECDSNLENMCRSLLNAGSEPNSYYLGHTALSLAMTKGNLKIMETLLKSGLTNPNQILEHNMGTPLTVLLLKRYKNLLTLEKSQEVYELLVKYQANPLNSTGELGNVIEFDIAEHTEPLKSKKGGKKGKGNKKDKKSSKKSSKGSKEGKGVLQTQDFLREFIADTARTMILKHAEGTVVKYLYDLITFNLHRRDRHPKYLAKMLTLKKARNTLQFLITQNVIQNSDSRVCYKLFEFIDSYGSVQKDNIDDEDDISFHEMVSNLDLTIESSTASNRYIVNPIIDADEEKYAVCFECLTHKDKYLIACPKCEQIYFCSQECNKSNNMRKPLQHSCGILFYNKEQHAQDEREARGEPRITSAMAEMREKIGRIKIDADIKLQKQKEYEIKIKQGIVPGQKGKFTSAGKLATFKSRKDAKKTYYSSSGHEIQVKKGESTYKGSASYHSDEGRGLGKKYGRKPYYTGSGHEIQVKKGKRTYKGSASYHSDEDRGRVERGRKHIKGKGKGRYNDEFTSSDSDVTRGTKARSKSKKKFGSSTESDITKKEKAKGRKSYTDSESEEMGVTGKLKSRGKSGGGKNKEEIAKEHKKRKGLHSDSEYETSTDDGKHKSKDKSIKGKSKHYSEKSDYDDSEEGKEKLRTSKAKQKQKTGRSDIETEDAAGKRKPKSKSTESSEIDGVTAKGKAKDKRVGKEKQIVKDHYSEGGGKETGKRSASKEKSAGDSKLAKNKLKQTSDKEKRKIKSSYTDSDSEDDRVKGKRNAKGKTFKNESNKYPGARENGGKGKQKSYATADAKEKRTKASNRVQSKSGTRSGGSSSGNAAATGKNNPKKKIGKGGGSPYSSSVNKGAAIKTIRPPPKSNRQTETIVPRARVAGLPMSQEIKKMNLYSSLRQGTKRLPLRFQYFMQAFAAYFDNFDWLNLMSPYTVYYNEQLYYKFSEDDQIFIGTYSDV